MGSFKETLKAKQTSNISIFVVDGITYASPKSIALLLNPHFVNTGVKLETKFGSVLHPSLRMDDCNAVFQFQPVASEFVLAQSQSLKTNKAIGLDKISSRMLTNAAHVIAQILMSLYNKSIETKTFPSVWKNAKVTAIFKCSDRKISSTY